MEHIETVIIGGGQAGLATSYYLTQYGREHLVKLPVRDGDGFPIQASGVTKHVELYFVGMPWMPSE